MDCVKLVPSTPTKIYVVCVAPCFVEMSAKEEQRHVIKFYWCHGKMAAQIFKKFKQVYSDEERLSNAMVFRWHKLFAEGSDSAKLLPHPGQKSTVIEEKLVNTVEAIIREDRHMSVRD